MAEAVLKFTLPEETSEFYNAVNGTGYKIVINDLINTIIRLNKIETDGVKYATRREVIELIYEYVQDGGLSLD
jgi:hypothetical protein